MHSLPHSAVDAKNAVNLGSESARPVGDDIPVVPCARVFVLLLGLVLVSWIAAAT